MTKKTINNRRTTKRTRRFNWWSWRKAFAFLAFVALGFVACFSYHHVRVDVADQPVAAAVSVPQIDTRQNGTPITYNIDDHSNITYNNHTDVGGVVVFQQKSCCSNQPPAIVYDFSNRLQQIQQNFVDLSQPNIESILIFNSFRVNMLENNYIQNNFGDCFRVFDGVDTTNTIENCVPQPATVAPFLMFGFLHSSLARRR